MTRFVFDFPIWVIVDPKALKSDGLCIAIRLATTADKGNVLPVFTDEDLAERFLRETGIGGASSHAIAKPIDLLPAVEVAQHAGIKLVGFDLGATPGSFRRFADIGEFIADLEASP